MNINKNSQDKLEILRKINLKPKYSQRQLAKDLGFSLGKLNYCILALKEKGLIKIKNFYEKKLFSKVCKINIPKDKVILKRHLK